MRLCRCPHCKGLLNPSNTITLLGRPAPEADIEDPELVPDLSPERERGSHVLFALEPEPGDYTYRVAQDVKIESGDRWVFFCPLCRRDLTSHFSNDLAHLVSHDEDGEEHVLVFSKRAGEHATFDVSSDGIEAFGEHHQKYVVINIQRHYW